MYTYLEHIIESTQVQISRFIKIHFSVYISRTHNRVHTSSDLWNGIIVNPCAHLFVNRTLTYSGNCRIHFDGQKLHDHTSTKPSSFLLTFHPYKKIHYCLVVKNCFSFRVSFLFSSNADRCDKTRREGYELGKALKGILLLIDTRFAMLQFVWKIHQ